MRKTVMHFNEIPKVTIVFEDKCLPHAAIFLDIATKAKSVSEETSIWFFHFSICVGRTCHAAGSEVSAHAAALASAIRMHQEEMAFIVHRAFLGEANAEEMIAEWLSALEIILEEARGKSQCSWRGQID